MTYFMKIRFLTKKKKVRREKLEERAKIRKKGYTSENPRDMMI